MIGDRREKRVADLRTYITAFFIATLVARILIALFVTGEGFYFSSWLDPSSWLSSIAVGFALTANGVFFDEHDVLKRLPVGLVVIIEVVFSTLVFRVFFDVFITQDFFTAAAWLEPKSWIGVGGFALISVVGRRYYAAKEAAHSDRYVVVAAAVSWPTDPCRSSMHSEPLQVRSSRRPRFSSFANLTDAGA